MEKLVNDVLAVLDLLKAINTDISNESLKGALTCLDLSLDDNLSAKERAKLNDKHAENIRILDARREFSKRIQDVVREFTNEYIPE